MSAGVFSNRFSLARFAYRRRDVEAAEAAHTHDRLETALYETGRHGEHLADAVLGATDGIVTTFAVVAGAAGASLSSGVVLIMGFANLFADGLSMAVGNYLGARSRQDFWREERAREIWEIEQIPDAEREEVRRHYRRKGFEGETLERIVGTITSDKQRWLDEMMREELGIREEKTAPLASGAITFAAFAVAGFLPLLSYAAAFFQPRFLPSAFSVSIALTAVALFGVGAARCFITRRRWWRSGIEILSLGGVAAACAFSVGYFLRALLE
ncbi:MAG TPA: VIT1/CCC1 transporter family protein [Candidatus Binatia bacterium]|jgi:VIT1/CCC1 family predicted Fe2+/Mn2+ transporter